jgi:manganese-transporting P-type ATPase C
MKPGYRLCHRLSCRTRIQFHGLLRNHELCQKVEGRLNQFIEFESVDVRPLTGSIILNHPNCTISIKEIVSAVYSVNKNISDKDSGLELSPEKGTSISNRSNKRKEPVYHVSGLSLIVSGAYLIFLYLKRVSLAALSVSPAGLLTLPAVATLALSLPIQRQAIDNLTRTGKPDMGLISTGLLYVSLITGNILSSFTVFWLFNLSGWLESKIKTRTRQTIRDMFAAKADTVWLVVEESEVETSVSDLIPGDIIILRFGSSIPADGVIIEGDALVNESTLTGESVPAHKVKNDYVFAGTMVEEGEISVRVEKTGDETRLAAIIRLIENAENEPGELQLTSRRFSQLMVPVSLSIAGGVFIFTGNLVQAMAVLIITCPCSLRLSTSVAISTAMARAAENGILVKGGRFIEAAGAVDALVVDKTGTLTKVKSSSIEIYSYDRRYSEKTIIQLAASTQKIWPHPVGQSILDKANDMELDLLPCKDAEFFVGRGVSANINGDLVYFGSKEFLEEKGVTNTDGRLASRSASPADIHLFLAKGIKVIAGFKAEQHIVNGAGKAIQRLRRAGVNDIALLSGDVRGRTEELGELLGFDSVKWKQSPENKAYWIKNHKKESPDSVVAMVGDGINDTPAFAASDLSISIADGGSDITVEYSDVVLQSGGLEKVADLIELGRTTDLTLKRSYAIAIGLNLVALVGTSIGFIAPVAGALFHNIITIVAVGNAATIQRIAADKSEK